MKPGNSIYASSCGDISARKNNIPVETLPSQLDGEQKEQWEQLKASRLRGRGPK